MEIASVVRTLQRGFFQEVKRTVTQAISNLFLGDPSPGTHTERDASHGDTPLQIISDVGHICFV